MSVKKLSVRINKEPAQKPAPHARDDLRRQKVAATRRARRVRGKILAGFLILSIAALVWLMRHPSLQIKEIIITGNQKVETTDIRRAVEANLTGSYFYIFPKNNFLLYPQAEIRRQISRISGYIYDADIGVSNFHTLNIKISERQAKYIWCGDSASTSSCYLADQTGLIFSSAPGISKNIMFTIYSPLPTNPQGKKPLTTAGFAKLDEAVGALPAILDFVGLKRSDVGAVRVSGDNDYFFIIEDIASRGPEEWELRFKAESQLSAIASYLKALWQSAEFQAERSNSALDYVDLRFGKKVYYKFD
ncbi:MAG: hypothetical protein A2571_02215 [Candidatus Vogelbacteria bacterium RIFOXYD1_FULL_44_32]|uniref:POTRA domain-containing protein n=1 Tax=Candidatus Vogelbacteria bacterium RIFOXYD1_FULL_44_32 TaxID=1802438 RepID=A0A1G2QEY9_9BACT|nr:MAG: hypothetical protein A2571_02215 [Candidatus Vogelbacteria bacterium RIFOXYD1_FULL_44_32]